MHNREVGVNSRAALVCPTSRSRKPLAVSHSSLLSKLRSFPFLRKDSRLRPIHSVKGLVQEQADGPAVIDPTRAILVQSRVVP